MGRDLHSLVSLREYVSALIYGGGLRRTNARLAVRGHWSQLCGSSLVEEGNVWGALKQTV